MFLRKFKKILLVSPDPALNHLHSMPINASNCEIFDVTSCSKVFASLFDKKPEAIVFDYDCLAKDAELVLRRIRSNSFYNSLKIYCYRNEADESVDSFLKAIGVDSMIYKTDVEKHRYASASPKSNDGLFKYISLNVAFK